MGHCLFPQSRISTQAPLREIEDKSSFDKDKVNQLANELAKTPIKTRQINHKNEYSSLYIAAYPLIDRMLQRCSNLRNPSSDVELDNTLERAIESYQDTSITFCNYAGKLIQNALISLDRKKHTKRNEALNEYLLHRWTQNSSYKQPDPFDTPLVTTQEVTKSWLLDLKNEGHNKHDIMKLYLGYDDQDHEFLSERAKTAVEIAATLDMKENTVRKVISRVLPSLRNQLKQLIHK